MKKIMFVVLLVGMLTISSVTAFAQDDIVVAIDSVAVGYTKESGIPFLDVNDRTQVPFRETLKAFGADINWDQEENTAVASKAGIVVKVPIGQNYILKNDQKIEIDTIAVLKDERTYLPIRVVIEALGGSIEYDGELNTLVIETVPVDTNAILTQVYDNSIKWSNYEMSMNMDMATSASVEGIVITVNTKTSGKSKVFVDPILIKQEMETTIDTMGATNVVPVVQYIEQDGGKIIVYQQINGEWSKIEQDMGTLGDLMNMDPAYNLKLTQKYMSEAKYLGKYDVEGTKLMKMKVTLNPGIYEELMGSVVSTDKTKEEQMMLDTLKSMGNFEYIMWINPDSKEICMYDMDLGSVFGNLSDNMLKSNSITQEEAEVIKNTKMKMNVKVSNINNVQRFEIPREAKN